MSDYNETDLLELIEGTAAPATARALEARLASDPDVQALIRQLRHDRQLLQGAAKPELSRDLIEALEPMLARPLLMESAPFRPGEFRRRRQRGARIRRRLAIAAGILIVPALTGIWLLIEQGLSLSADERLADASDVASEAASQDRIAGATSAPVAEPAWPPPNAAVHHRWKSNDERLMLARGGGEERGPAAIPGERIVASFTVALADSVDPSQALIAALQPAGDRIALVRNLTLDDAREIERAWIASKPDSSQSSRPVSIAGTETNSTARLPELQELARRVGEQRRGDTTAHTQDALLAGSKELAPSYVQQIEYSDTGAAYTVSIPLADLDAFLSKLQEVTLVSAGHELPATRSEARLASLHDRAAIIKWLSNLRRTQPKAVLMVPVHVLPKNK